MRRNSTGHQLQLSRIYLAEHRDLYSYLLPELLTLDVQIRRSKGQIPRAEEYRDRFPEASGFIDELFALDVTQAARGAEVDGDGDEDEAKQKEALEDPLPERIGRYEIRGVLGHGGFGVVYLAYDEQLTRSVAIKVPHRKLVAKAEDAELYLSEARTVANLDHPSIVPVHDVGSDAEFPCYIVNKYIEGADLQFKLKEHQYTFRGSDSIDCDPCRSTALRPQTRIGAPRRKAGQYSDC